MDWNSEIMTVVAKTAGIGGIAVFAAAMVFRDLIQKKSLPILKKDHAYKLLMLTICFAGAIAIIGILSWTYIELNKKLQPSEADSASKAANDSQLLQANELHYTDPTYTKAYELIEASANNNNPISMAQQAGYLHDGVGTAIDLERAELLASKSAQTLEYWCTNLNTPAACFSLSILYGNGMYVKSDAMKTFQLVQKAAMGGYKRAFNPLAQILYEGEGTKKDIKQAISWYKKAINQGYPRPMYNLSLIYKKEDEYKDAAEALKLLQRAADLGFPLAQLDLAIAYESGEGVKVDLLKAKELLQTSANNGYSPAQVMIANKYSSGDSFYPRDEKRAFEWYLKAASAGNSLAQINVSRSYRVGRGVLLNATEAVNWAKRAAETGDSDAEVEYGQYFSRGEIVKKDPTEAFKWYMKSAMQNNPWGQHSVAYSYQYGEGVEEDLNKAIEWAKKSAEQHFAPGQALLALLYDIQGDDISALEWYKKAAENNAPDAANNAGVAYETGQMVSPDNSIASNYYKKALDLDPTEELYFANYWGVQLKLTNATDEKLKILATLEDRANMNGVNSQWILAEVYSGIRNFPADAVKERYWLEKSAINEHKCASLSWGIMLMQGDGVKQDIVSGVRYIEKADSLGAQKAAYNLGVIYMEGKYTTKNVAKGLEYLERGAEEGNLESLIYLSKLYREGTDLPRSIVKANAYLTQAAERGSSDAIKKLEERESEDLLSCTASNR